MVASTAKKLASPSFLARLLGPIIVVMMTYNPTGVSYVHWVMNAWSESTALIVLAGMVLLVAYAVLLRSTLYSIGVAGSALVIAVLAAIVWVLVDAGILTLAEGTVLQWLTIIVIGMVLSVGLSWAIIRRRLSGQVSVDDVETGAEE